MSIIPCPLKLCAFSYCSKEHFQANEIIPRIALQTLAKIVIATAKNLNICIGKICIVFYTEPVQQCKWQMLYAYKFFIARNFSC